MLPEWHKLRDLLGGPDEVERFTRRALARLGLRRMFLHAWRLRFTHPATGEAIALQAPLPL